MRTHSRPAHHQRKRDKGLLNCIQCASESSCLKEILAALENAPVLTVSDVPDFVSRGGMIEFVTKENKVQFEVNLTAAGKAGLPLSSQLLKVTTEVEKDSPDGDVKP